MTTGVTVPSNGHAIIGVTWYGGQNVSASGWTVDHQAQASADANFRCALLSRPGALASSSTITANWGGNVDARNIFGIYFTGVHATVWEDASATGSDGNASWDAAITTVTANTVLVACSWIDFATTASTPLTNYTEVIDQDGAGGGYKVEMVYRIVTSTGAYTIGGATGNGNQNVVAAVAYKEDAGGGGGTASLVIPTPRSSLYRR